MTWPHPQLAIVGWMGLLVVEKIQVHIRPTFLVHTAVDSEVESEVDGT